jgi:hypothetical protein
VSNEQKRNTINRSDFFKLCKWLDENRATVEKQETYAAIGKIAQEAIQLTAATSAIKQAMETTGVRLATPKQPVSIDDGLAVVASELVRLMEAIGNKPSDTLLQLARPNLCGFTEAA